MANDLTKLFVVIGLKSTDLEKGLNKTKYQLTQIGATMTIVGAAITGTLAAITVKWASAGDEIAKLAQKTGFSTEALSELKYAAQLSGGSLSGLEMGIKRMQYAILQGGYGLMTYTRLFQDLGLTIDQLKGMAPEQQFYAIMTALADIADPTQKAAIAVSLFGRAGTDMLPMLSDGSAGLEEMRAEAEKLGIVFDSKAAKSAEAFNDSFTRLKASLSGATMMIAGTLAPVITNLANAISSIITKIKNWTDAHPGLTKVLSNLALALGIFCTIMGTGLLLIPRIAKAVKLLGAAFQGSLGPIGWVSLAISGIITVGTLLIGNWDKIISVFQGPAVRATKKLEAAMKDLKESLVPQLQGAIQTVKDDYQSFIDFLQTGQYKNAGFLSEDQLAKVRAVNPELADQLRTLQEQAEAQDAIITNLEAMNRAARETEITGELEAIASKLKNPILAEADRNDLLQEQRDLDEELARIQGEDARTAYQNLLDANAAALASGLQDQFDTVWDPYFEAIKNGFNDVATFVETDWTKRLNDAVAAGLIDPEVAKGIIDQINAAITDYRASVAQGPVGAEVGGVVVGGVTPQAQTPSRYLTPDQLERLLSGLPGGAEGGLQLSPAIMKVAETQPEALIPLDQLNLGGGGNVKYESHLHVGTLVADDFGLRKLAKILKQYQGEDNRRNFFPQVQKGYGFGTSSK